MKTRHSYLAICVAASLYAPSVFSDVNKTVPESSTSGSDPVNGISNIYSDMDMRMRLVTKPNEKACSGDLCLSNQVFDGQVQALGVRLAQSAYTVYPDLKKKIPNFVFGVADKKVVGSASNAKGNIILFRGLQHWDLDEKATAFIVAREMGHVIANHHKSNAKTKIFFTILAGVLFPAVNILTASGAAAQATTATTLLTSAASTATSYVSSEVALARIKPTQLTEADDIALKLLEREGWDKADVAQSLEYISENEKSTAWEKDLYQSVHYVRKVAGEPNDTVAELEPLPEPYVALETNVVVPIEQVAQNPVEQRKVILITHQTIAESHHIPVKLGKKQLVPEPVMAHTEKSKFRVSSKPKPVKTDKNMQSEHKQTIKLHSKTSSKKSANPNAKPTKPVSKPKLNPKKSNL